MNSKIEQIKEKVQGTYYTMNIGDGVQCLSKQDVIKWLSELEPHLKSEKDELLIELGEHIFNNLELLDGRIGEPDTYDDLKPDFKKALEIVDKLRELK